MEFIEEKKNRDKIGIYYIKNIETGKFYIGQTKEKFIRRFWLHRWELNKGTHHSQKLQRSYNKHGSEKFIFGVLQEVGKCDNLQKILNDLEIYYINILNSLKNGYNIQPGGQSGNLQNFMSPEARKRIGELNRQRMLGSKLSEETKRKMRESSHHRSPTKEQREKLSEYMKNRIVSDETKKKLSEANLGEKSPAATFTNEQVKHIKMLMDCGIAPIEVARIFNRSKHTIYAIRYGKAWTHLTYNTLFFK